jgi:hypothetical protein
VFCIESITVDCLYLVNVSLNVLLKLSLIAIVAKPGGRLNNCHVSNGGVSHCAKK